MRSNWSEKIRSLFVILLTAILLISLFPLWRQYYLAWIALVPLLWDIRTKKGGNPFLRGWLTGILFFYGILYWLAGTMVSFGGLHPLLSHLFLVVLCLYLGLYLGAFCMFSDQAYRRLTIPFAILAPVLWVALELIRSRFLTGFPWGLLGYSQIRAIGIIQISDITGVYGISFLIVLVNAGITDMLALYLCPSPEGGISTSIAKEALALGIVMTLVITYGGLRLRYNPSSIVEDGLSIAIIQGNIPQGASRGGVKTLDVLSAYGEKSLKQDIRSHQLIVWPENACPSAVFLGEGTNLHILSSLAAEAGTHLLLGSPRYDEQMDGIFNSALFFSPSGELDGFYDKIHLVPFGEYFPFLWVSRMLGDLGSFMSGRDFKIFRIDGKPFSVAICFEAIFPDFCRRFVRKGAVFLVNLTNDIWFGNTAAPYQHFDMACMRAVENRIWFVRAANTGISGFIDPWGRVVKRGGIFQETEITGSVFDAPLTSLYTKIGDSFALCCLFLFFLWCVLIVKRSKVKKRD